MLAHHTSRVLSNQIRIDLVFHIYFDEKNRLLLFFIGTQNPQNLTKFYDLHARKKYD